MDLGIAGILALDGLTNGAIYALLALATVLLFAVTRVIFIPQGEFVAYGALTLAMLQLGRVPGSVWLLLVLGSIAALRDAIEGMGRTVFSHGVMNWTKDDHWGFTNETGVMLKVVNGDWKVELPAQ